MLSRCVSLPRRIRQTKPSSVECWVNRGSTRVDALFTRPNASELPNTPYSGRREIKVASMSDALIGKMGDAVRSFNYNVRSKRSITTANGKLSSNSFKKDLPRMIAAVSESPSAKCKNAKGDIKCRSWDSGITGGILVGRGNRRTVDSNRNTCRASSVVKAKNINILMRKRGAFPEHGTEYHKHRADHLSASQCEQ